MKLAQLKGKESQHITGKQATTQRKQVATQEN